MFTDQRTLGLAVPRHEYHMRRAIDLARRAEGNTSPNPLVGCVLTQNDNVVGEGWHRAAGQAHAEVNAINKAGDQAQGATLYVTLEPCNHFGRTPPCTHAIKNAGIKTVVFAVDDPNPSATGGADFLRESGIEVISQVLEAEARYVNRFYLHFQKLKRPYVVAKYAASLDGRIATRSGHSQWITGPQARMKGHQLRQAVDAIVVGAQTVIDDDPQLTVRLPEETSNQGPSIQHPRRFVLDSKGRIPLEQKIFSDSLPGNTEVITTEAMSVSHENALLARDIKITRLPGSKNGQIELDLLTETLGQRGIQSVMVESGQTLLGAFLDAALINEIWAFLAPKLIGGKEAPAAIGGLGVNTLEQAPRLQNLRTDTLGPDLLIRGQLDYQQENA